MVRAERRLVGYSYGMPNKRRQCDDFKCNVCGRFVSYADLDSGAAIHDMVTPSSHLTMEEWETLCARCHQKARYSEAMNTIVVIGQETSRI